MNILYRPLSELTVNKTNFEERLMFYQSHYYDNIYYTSNDGSYIGSVITRMNFKGKGTK